MFKHSAKPDNSNRMTVGILIGREKTDYIITQHTTATSTLEEEFFISRTLLREKTLL